MEKQTNVPKLRFPEFQGKWECKNISEVADKVNSGKTPLGGESVYVKQGILFIRSQNVTDDELSIENSTYITDSVNKSMSNSEVRPNDILLNITGASLGRSCVVPCDFKVGNVNQHVCIVRIDEKNEPRFIQPIFVSEKGQNIFTSLQTGSGREGLNFQSIKGISLNMPTLSEQIKIANVLTTVNVKQKQLSKKRSLLEQYKKGVMQQLFSQELRFKDKDGNDFGDWKKNKLGKIGTFFSGGTPLTTKRKFFDGEIPFIRSGEINSEKTEQFLSEMGLKNSSSKMIEVGDLIYALYGATSGEVAISRIKGAINQAILCIRTNEVSRFLYYYLLLNKEVIIKTYLQGGQGNLSADIIKSIEVPLPSLPEQQKIATFLSSLDSKIAQTSQQIVKMQLWKKGLLQQMFV